MADREHPAIDLNADVGEGYDDQPLFPFLTSVNVACGAHAGDEETMFSTVDAAARAGLAVGAHPSFPDREGFGRRITTHDPEAIRELVGRQTAALAEIASRVGTPISHVKPHGALYNLAAVERPVAEAVALGVRDVAPSCALVGLAGSMSLAAASAVGLAPVAEAFVDRGYDDDGRLVPRGQAGAVVDSPATAATRAVALALHEPIESVSGNRVDVSASTLCLHGDTPGALAMARAVYEALTRAAIPLGRK